jgi:hypothetical protein
MYVCMCTHGRNFIACYNNNIKFEESDRNRTIIACLFINMLQPQLIIVCMLYYNNMHNFMLNYTF